MADRGSSGLSSGIGAGCALAMTISWSIHHSILWAMIHGILGWLYVITWAICGTAPWING